MGCSQARGKGKRGWKKLHLGVCAAGKIVAQSLTDGNADDGREGLVLIDAVDGEFAGFTADAAYDSIAIYKAAGDRGASFAVPPPRTATAPRRRKPRSAERDRTIATINEFGRREWKKESGYHRQGQVENALFRYKSILGSRLRSRHPRAQAIEALIGCNVLNRNLELGWPVSMAIKT